MKIWATILTSQNMADEDTDIPAVSMESELLEEMEDVQVDPLVSIEGTCIGIVKTDDRSSFLWNVVCFTPCIYDHREHY